MNQPVNYIHPHRKAFKIAIWSLTEIISLHFSIFIVLDANMWIYFLERESFYVDTYISCQGIIYIFSTFQELC